MNKNNIEKSKKRKLKIAIKWKDLKIRINLLYKKDPNISKNKVRRISRFIDNILALKAGKLKVRDEIECENLFFEMEWVVNNI